MSVLVSLHLGVSSLAFADSKKTITFVPKGSQDEGDEPTIINYVSANNSKIGMADMLERYSKVELKGFPAKSFALSLQFVEVVMVPSDTSPLILEHWRKFKSPVFDLKEISASQYSLATVPTWSQLKKTAKTEPQFKLVDLKKDLNQINKKLDKQYRADLKDAIKVCENNSTKLSCEIELVPLYAILIVKNIKTQKVEKQFLLIEPAG